MSKRSEKIVARSVQATTGGSYGDSLAAVRAVRKEVDEPRYASSGSALRREVEACQERGLSFNVAVFTVASTNELPSR